MELLMFESLPARCDFPAAELRVLDFWQKHDVFGKSLEIRRNQPRFVFYEGPPTANGLPHPGHCLTRAIKDLFPRYQTMCGRLVERKAGWDTHGLPVEVEVCKQLGIHTKEEIEQYGLEKFVRKCIDSVFKYVEQWEHMTRRLGFWVNLDEAYVTFHQRYVESVWWGLKTLFERGLLYQGHKVVWWWAQGGTALSAGEVGEGYRTVDDPSVYIRFPLPAGPHADARDKIPPDARVALLVWTTTPWTLISNHFAAVGPDIDYALIHDRTTDEYLYVASALAQSVVDKLKHDFAVVAVCKGTDLVGLRYEPPFDCFHQTMKDRQAALKAGGQDYIGWRVLPADFVTLDAGTGLVHQAPAFGEVDFELLQQERKRFADFEAIPLINAVKPDGTFSDEAPEAYRGRWVKDCDQDIMRELKQRGILVHHERVTHEYPFCPRAEDDALIQYARKSWFVRTSKFKDEFLDNNAGINWLPEHIRAGRFGDFLRNNVDWALSRERYWGTPAPIWVCEQTGKMEAVGSYAELLAKPGVQGTEVWEQAREADPAIPEHLKVHKPYIDAVTYDSPFAKGARMRRVPEVIDCWWDAGSMPFAQWGFPHAEGSVQTFAERFPCDFISEAIDQTRGWFYGLLAISTLLFGQQRDEALMPAASLPKPAAGHPYKTCIVLGHVMGEDGLKMSKRTKNYREPDFIFDHYGADAMRWYFFAAQTPWTSVRFQEAAIRDAQREFLLRLYNVFSFFNIYANIDGFDAVGAHCPLRPGGQRCELDRWILSELHRTIRAVRTHLDSFENYPAAGRLNQFVDALSNWYVRRSRERFWKGQKDQDKWDAYHTLYEVLTALARMLAPFTPFLAETMYQNLVRPGHTMQGSAAGEDSPLSVHLCDYPQPDETLIDEKLAREMDLVRQIVSLGRAARTQAKLKVRQPLAQVEIVLAQPDDTDWLRAHSELIAEELNIKAVEFTTEADQYVSYQVKPNFKTIGPKYGALKGQVAAALQALNAADARQALATTGEVVVAVNGQHLRLSGDDVDVRLEAKPGWSAAQGRAGVVVVRTELTDELRQEGLVRELIHQVQSLRKSANLPYEARVKLFVDGPAELAEVVRRFSDTVARECLAPQIEYDLPPTGTPTPATIESFEVRLLLEPV
jgi:isoleucyl-tRNA synthetase